MKLHFYLEDIVSLCDHNHLSANDIFIELKKKYKNIARASVYRNLQKLVIEWDLTEVKVDSKKVFYEKTIQPHIHFVDQYWNISDIDINFNNLKLDIPDNFEAKKINIVIYGEKKH